MRFKVRKVSLAIILQLKNEMPHVDNLLVPVTVRPLPSSSSSMIPLSLLSFLRTFEGRCPLKGRSCRPFPAPPLGCSVGPEPQLEPTLRRIQSPRESSSHWPVRPLPSPHWLPYRKSRLLGSSGSICLATEVKWEMAGKATSKRAAQPRNASLGARGGRGDLDDSLKASSSSPAPLPRNHGTTAWSAARSMVLGRALRAAPPSVRELSAARAGVAHTTEASPDTEATLLSSAQGCRFCSAKSDELCRQSGSGGSGGRRGRGRASCCRCRSSRPARCRSASRSSAVWRLGKRKRGVS